MIGKRITLQEYKDDRGDLISVNDIPFSAKRVFFITDVKKGSSRGNHASKTACFMYVLLNGYCKVELDDGYNIELHELTKTEALIFPRNTWMKIFDFEPETILCVLSDVPYHSEDYVNDYEEFCRIVRKTHV